jgi:flavin reductase (DIM6/NTAB) family NADH-FMN oxidoreductase RutF
MIVDPKTTEVLPFYGYMIGSITPRPIAFVSTMSASGGLNLAPFSFFSVASVDPPVICFNPLTHPGGRRKDTVRNIEATKEFVVNIVSESFAEKMNQCSAEVPPEVDEFKLSGLTPAPSHRVKPPSVAESHVHFECRLRDIIRFGDRAYSGNLVLGDVLLIDVDDAVLDKDKLIDRVKLATIGRMGGPSYVRTKSDCFDLARPVV